MAKYLYNGVELPALPEWDKAKYPYAYIYSGTDFFYKPMYTLHLTSNPYYAVSNDGKYCIGRRAGDINYKAYEDSNEFAFGVTYTNAGVNTELKNVVWANFDVLNTDGTLYLAASEPVPVLPKVSPQLAFTIGKQLGRRIFR